MTEYRKRGTRTFYKLIDGVTIRIVNAHDDTEVLVVKNWMCESDIFGKIPDERVKPCTEEEFNAAKSEAMKRLQSEQI